MSGTPGFASTPLNGAAAVSATADNVYSSPAHAVSVVSAGSLGSKIDEIDVVGTGTTSACVVNIYLYNGTTYFLIDSFEVSAVTVSATQSPFQGQHAYQNLILENGWSIYTSCTVASQPIVVHAFGGSE